MTPRLLALPLLLAVLGACGPGAPAIQEVSPAKGEQNVAGDAPIRVVFNHDMDHASVEARFHLKPAIEGCDPSSCATTWSGRTLTFNHPRHQFAPDTAYRASLASGYRDASGQVQSSDHFWDFHTEAAPSIGAVAPADGSSGAAVDTDVTIQLSRNVVVPPPMEVTLVGAGDPEPVAYRAAVAPDDPRRMVISPLSLLRPLTGYVLHIGGALSDTHHNQLGTSREVRFRTGRLDLSRSLAVLARDPAGTTASRVLELRPPSGLGAPAPGLRVLYHSSVPILDYGWSSDASALDVLGADGRLQVVPLDGTATLASVNGATAMAPNPVRSELAYVSGGMLHLWQPAATAADAAVLDVTVAQPGAVRGRPAWSGDGRRLAVIVDDAHGGGLLRVVDRETLSTADVPGVTVAATAALAWSPDGTALAFARSTGEVWDFRPAAAQGSGLVDLGSLAATSLAWSSDGATIFAVGPSPGSGGPLVYRAAGQPVDGQPAAFVAVAGSRAGDDQAATPSFDRRVAFVRLAAGVPQLFVMNNDGTGVAQLTFPTYDLDERLVTDGVQAPRWSPGNAP